VINVFLQDFYTRLRTWHELKEALQEKNLETICIEVDKFWQRCPMHNHYLHPDEIENWPNPWELLKDNSYCDYGRALGMIYTLLQLGVKSIDFVEALYDNREDVVLVLVDNAKYVLNWYPDSVLNTSLTDFTITKHISIESLVKKIGKE
jgi:hypothetical protein